MSASYNASSWKVDEFMEYASLLKDFEVARWQLKRPDLAQFALHHAAIPEIKSNLFEALETLRAWYLDEEWQRKQSKIRKWTG